MCASIPFSTLTAKKRPGLTLIISIKIIEQESKPQAHHACLPYPNAM